MAKPKQRIVRVRPETARRMPAAAPAPPQRRATFVPVAMWGVGVAIAVGLAIALVAAVGASGLTGHNRWGFYGCLFVLGMAALLSGAKAAEAYLNWKQPGWQPTGRKDP